LKNLEPSQQTRLARVLKSLPPATAAAHAHNPASSQTAPHQALSLLHQAVDNIPDSERDGPQALTLIAQRVSHLLENSRERDDDDWGVIYLTGHGRKIVPVALKDLGLALRADPALRSTLARKGRLRLITANAAE